ncbi:hypothetical protein SAMN04488109_2636 [Chryseolinea serpens]|uniref:Uncharacterized protein n=1 Tax=Chryseolinea serpens TaxID=947013 RepID=A0A1M5P368_9BACT|nr:hypothetical protein [Chryseolinea serpens]SHG95849.1 hypothetical protein SAMN04488109_2636 [Chryseolinea serpens]
MYPDNFIPKSVEDFYANKKDPHPTPPIAFTMQVIATDVAPDHPDFKIKILLDFVPEFTTERNRDNPNFSGRGVRSILNFVSNKVLPKVLEFVYYDVGHGAMLKSYHNANAEKPDREPPGYEKVMEVYEKRREKKEKLSKAQKKSKNPDVDIDIPDPEGESLIEKHLETLMKKDTPYWSRESTVSRVTYTRLSAARMTVEQRTAVNGDKKLPK